MGDSEDYDDGFQELDESFGSDLDTSKVPKEEKQKHVAITAAHADSSSGRGRQNGGGSSEDGTARSGWQESNGKLGLSFRGQNIMLDGLDDDPSSQDSGMSQQEEVAKPKPEPVVAQEQAQVEDGSSGASPAPPAAERSHGDSLPSLTISGSLISQSRSDLHVGQQSQSRRSTTSDNSPSSGLATESAAGTPGPSSYTPPPLPLSQVQVGGAAPSVASSSGSGGSVSSTQPHLPALHPSKLSPGRSGASPAAPSSSAPNSSRQPSTTALPAPKPAQPSPGSGSGGQQQHSNGGLHSPHTATSPGSMHSSGPIPSHRAGAAGAHGARTGTQASRRSVQSLPPVLQPHVQYPVPAEPPSPPAPKARHTNVNVDARFLASAAYTERKGVGKVYDWQAQHQKNQHLSKLKQREVRARQVLEAAKKQLEVKLRNEAAFEQWLQAKEQTSAMEAYRRRQLLRWELEYQAVQREDAALQQSREWGWNSSWLTGEDRASKKQDERRQMHAPRLIMY